MILQNPNPPLWTWIIATALTHLLQGILAQIAMLVALGAILTWAWLEMVEGESIFRHFLGALVVFVTLFHALSSG